FQFALDTAIAEKNKEAIKELKSIQPHYPPNGKPTVDDLLVQRKWLNYYGGALYKERGLGKVFDRVPMQGNPLYDSAKFNDGNAFSLKTMFSALMDANLMKTATKLDVPVYFLAGRHDYNTPFALVEEYYKVLNAPHKEIIWFENSAHAVP